VRVTEKSRTDNVSVQFCELMKKLGLHRDGISFYVLRHCFRTVADAARDTVATDIIMGHTDPSMGGHYRERVEDSRLQAVAELVRAWLLGESPEDDTTGEPDNTAADDCDQEEPAEPLEQDDSRDRPRLRLFAG
jgi:hypothetical protein